MYYLEVLKSLSDNHIRHLLVGGLSVNLHGVPRFTQDIDIIIDRSEVNVLKLVEVLKGLDYTPALPNNPVELADDSKVNEWITKRNLKAFSFRHAKDQQKVVDILLVYPLNFEEAFKKRMVKKVQDFEISYVALDDLIVMKEYSARPQDLSDVEMLKQVKELSESYNA